MKANKYNRHIQIAILYFGIAALLGLLLRAYAVFPFGFNYKYMVHGHSHIALLGWVYVALTTMLHYLFVDRKVFSKKYQRLFWGTQGTLIGMLLTFPFQGYAVSSIVFSTLFLVLSYIYTYHFWKNIDPVHTRRKSLRIVKAALIYMIISSIGPWALGAIMSTVGPESVWYRLSIYFYLHFQYNGWMVLAILGMFMYLLERLDLELHQKTFSIFFISINLSIVLSFLLSALWTNASIWLNILAGLGAMLQWFAFVHFWSMIKSTVFKLKLTGKQKLLLKTVVILLTIKITLQIISALPYFAQLIATYLDLTIGYLHLTFLGVISLGILFLSDYFKLIRLSNLSMGMYLVGFMLTELLIFYKGLAAWIKWPVFKEYTTVLFSGSTLILFALAILSYQNYRKV